MNSFGRREFLGGVASATLLMATPALAMSTSAAEQFVGQAIGELEAILNSGQSGAALQGTLIGFFRKYADVPTVARAVIGPAWRGMSQAQRNAYVSAFETYVTRKYAQQFDVLKGGKASISGSRDGGKAGVLVNAQFARPSSSPVGLSLQVSDQSGAPKILDMQLAGVSMISTEREQVRALLAQNGNNVDALIAVLKG